MARKKAAASSLVCSLLLSFILVSTAAHNITEILEGYPDFTVFNQMLSNTGVADEINARATLTILAPSNDAMNAFKAANPDISLEKAADVLRYHVLLRYVTVTDITDLEVGKYLEVSTLYSTTGRTGFDEGDVNIFNGLTKILVGHAVRDNSTMSVIVSTVYQQPLEINVLMIDRTLEPVGFAQANRDTANITAILVELGGYTTFTKLLMQTGVDETFNVLQTRNGITIFVPTDDAFDALAGGWIERLDLEQQKLLLSYHALARYRSQVGLLFANGSFIPTVATTMDSTPNSFQLSIEGDQVSVTVTILSSTPKGPKVTVMSTLYDGNPLIMFSIDAVLCPVEFSHLTRLGPVPAPAPSIAPQLEPPPVNVDNNSRSRGRVQTVSPVAPPVTSTGYTASVQRPVLTSLLSIVAIFLGCSWCL
ncbi:hypothetical protein R1flu_024032 [Riccia fluitans]|uniref:FAS1 domain-containing protein n=1 Tax=Riccia fluitans TaxID=41844 RepID=A0ABD1XU68_9MARC